MERIVAYTRYTEAFQGSVDALAFELERLTMPLESPILSSEPRTGSRARG